MKSKCELVRKKEIKHIPRDWQDKGTPNCLGYEDSRSDEPLAECERCEWFWGNWSADDENGRKAMKIEEEGEVEDVGDYNRRRY